MARLLYVQASPMKAASTSTGVAQTFLQAYRSAHPADQIDCIDLWDIDLPPFDAEMIGAKFAVLRSHDATHAQRARWAEATKLARRFDAADKVLFSVPMWNFGVPYRLKHFIDVVTLPGGNWSWSREAGYIALKPGKRAVLVYSSAGEYPLLPHEDASDFQKPYLRRWLAFLGFEQVYEVAANPTLTAPERLAEVKQTAAARAIELASTLLMSITMTASASSLRTFAATPPLPRDQFPGDAALGPT